MAGNGRQAAATRVRTASGRESGRVADLIQRSQLRGPAPGNQAAAAVILIPAVSSKLLSADSLCGLVDAVQPGNAGAPAEGPSA